MKISKIIALVCKLGFVIASGAALGGGKGMTKELLRLKIFYLVKLSAADRDQNQSKINA